MDCSLYEQSLFRQAAGAEFRPGGLALTDELAAECGLTPGTAVLDLACGVGSTASHLAHHWGAVVAGLDGSPRFIEEAAGRDPGVIWMTGSADNLPFADGSFDAVFCECFLSTVAEPESVLREMRRVLRPGGRLALSDMYLRNPGRAAAPPAAAPPAAASSAAASSVAAPPAAAPRPTAAAAAPPQSTCLNGATGREATLALLERTGFAVRTWRDRSDALKSLFAALIMTYGSAAAFWAAAAGAAGGAADRGAGRGGATDPGAGRDGAAPAWLAEAKPGYYILVAEAVPLGATEVAS